MISKFDKQFWALENQRRYILEGKADYMFADEETKAHFLADIDAEQNALITAELKANPGLYKQYQDGSWGLFPDSERKVITLNCDGRVTE
jgi:hypothetical protein